MVIDWVNFSCILRNIELCRLRRNHMGVESDDSLQGGSERCVCVCVCVLRQTRVGRTNTESNGSAHRAMYSL